MPLVMQGCAQVPRRRGAHVEVQWVPNQIIMLKTHHGLMFRIHYQAHATNDSHLDRCLVNLTMWGSVTAKTLNHGYR